MVCGQGNETPNVQSRGANMQKTIDPYKIQKTIDSYSISMECKHPRKRPIKHYRYVISALLCVTLDGQMVGQWVFMVDVTKRVVSVMQRIGLKLF